MPRASSLTERPMAVTGARPGGWVPWWANWGEFAEIRLKFDAGEMPATDFAREAAKELADVQIYLDLLARRSLDEIDISCAADDADVQLLAVIAALGAYANLRKKFDHGDIDTVQFRAMTESRLEAAQHAFEAMRLDKGTPAPVHHTHPEGVDLGTATREKFNELTSSPP